MIREPTLDNWRGEWRIDDLPLFFNLLIPWLQFFSKSSFFNHIVRWTSQFRTSCRVLGSQIGKWGGRKVKRNVWIFWFLIKFWGISNPIHMHAMQANTWERKRIKEERNKFWLSDCLSVPFELAYFKVYAKNNLCK